MRREFVVAYDISGPRRLRQVFKIMRGYGDALQLSVFRCFLSASERVRLKAELDEVIHHKEDQILFIELGPEENSRDSFETMGRAMVQPDRHAIVI